MSDGYVLPVRVYLEDTDAQGVVYNASYFRFMERARTEWLRARGIDHNCLRDQEGAVFVVARIETSFRVPARLDDMLYVCADLARLGGARFFFEQRIRRGSPDGELLCEAVCEVACMDAEQHKPRRLPSSIRDELSGNEKSE